MVKYILSRKEVDEAIIEWEKQHDKGSNNESLFMFISKRQAIKMLKDIQNYGIDFKICEELLEKLNATSDRTAS